MNTELSPRRVSYGRMVAGLFAGVLATVGVALLGASAQAVAAEHVFNAKLSLTGDCSVSAKIDIEPDPGCPGGAHPPQPFSRHAAVAVDPHGNRYVASTAVGNNGGRVDVFTSAGEFITQVQVALPELEGSIAVDSQGNLYVLRRLGDFLDVEYEPEASENLVRFEPTQYNPAAGEIAYDPMPVVVPHEAPHPWAFARPAIAINPKNDHLFVVQRAVGQQRIAELNSASEGNTVVRTIHLEGIEDTYRWANTMALDATRNRLYVTDLSKAATSGGLPVVKAFDLSSPADPEEPRELLYTLDGTTTPTNRFVSETRVLPLAVDESNGHLFVGDMEAPTARIYEFDTTGEPVGTIEGRLGSTGAFNLQMAHDNSATSPTQGYLFVPSNSNPSRSLAYGPPPPIGPPLVGELSFSGVSTSDAILRGLVNPEGLETDWRLEYTTEQSFLANGFEGAVLAGEGTLEEADFELAVSAPAIGLSPGTAYRFRLVAENEEGEDEAEAGFSTYSLPDISSDCPNQALRTGPSAGLPDCRAYELVTPTNTNGRAPQVYNSGGSFPSPVASPAGDAVSFAIEGTVLPGFEGTANLFGDPYLARRGQQGWKTEATGPSGAFSEGVLIGTPSPDQGHLAWATDGQGPGRLEGTRTAYVRYPDGHFQPAGEGSLATDPGVAVRLISANGAHVVFDTGGEGVGKRRQLEPNAPPDGTIAIYDRTADGTLHVVSLLPGEVTPGAGQDASFVGASRDGKGVAFTIGGNLYLRYDNEATYEVAPQALVGRKISCDPGSSLLGATPTYQWLLDGIAIPSATSSTYTPDSSQAGSVLQCRVRAVNPEGGALAFGQPLLVEQVHDGGPVPRPFKIPQLPPAPSAGQTLQCEAGAWSADPSFAYQWYRDGDAIGGASEDSYELQAEDVHTQVQCVITATASGTSVLATAGPREVGPIPAPPSGGSPSVTNSSNPGQPPVVGDQLSCAKGTWQNEPALSVQWLANDAVIAAATADTYTLTAEEEGDAVQCEVSATNADGTAEAVSNAVAVGPTLASELPSGNVSASGVRAVGNTLECNAGSWTNEPAFSYQWLRNGAPIGSATSSTYTLTATDRETVVQCALSATNAKGAVRAVAGGFINEKPRPTASTAAVEVEFAGVVKGGKRAFYVQGGDLRAFDAGSGATVEFTQSGDVIPVNVASGGAAAYLVSPSVLDADPNPVGETAEPGAENLWLSREGQISFVGTLSQRDVEGVKQELEFGGGGTIRGLGLWVDAAKRNPAVDPSRSTSDGSVLVFESNAPLTDFDPQGHTQIYRYDMQSDTLRCLSCNPAGVSTGDNALQAVETPVPLLRANVVVSNLSLDGERAFFESTESLVAHDVDGLRDVYEWEEEGTGSCGTAGGCLYLITAGNSARDDYLWGVSESGNDVFVFSGDLLAPAFDQDETASIYTARVNGGFAPPKAPAGECLGEACQPAARAPEDPTPTSSVFHGAGNMLEPARSCAPAARRAKRLGRVARKLRRAARRNAIPARSRKLHRRANRAVRRAKRQRANTRRCRAAGKRANSNGRAGR